MSARVLRAVDNRGRGVASAEPRPARAAATAAAASTSLYDGLHYGMRLLERFVLLLCNILIMKEVDTHTVGTQVLSGTVLFLVNSSINPKL